MAQFEPQKQEIEKRGSLVFVAAQKRGGFFKPEKFLEKQPVPFPFLLDEDRRVTRSYGVHQALGKDGFNIAHPATFVLDREGKVRYSHVGKSQTDRAPMDQVMAAFRGQP